MHTKHKYDGEDLKKLEIAFRKIAKEYPLRKKFYQYDLQCELAALNTECKLVCAMYKLNDFRASSYAYAFTTKKIDEIVEYCYKNTKNKSVFNWGNEKSDFAVARMSDGSTKQYTNIAYLYEYLYNQQLAIAARYFIDANIQYLEKDKQKKAYPRRKKVLEAAVWWENQGLLGRFGLKMPFTPKEYDFTPRLLIFSTFPSSGKTFLVNTSNEMFMQLNNIINEQGGVLRIGNEEGNILAQSRDTMDLIRNPLSLDVYPENKKAILNGKYKPFSKESECEWGLVGTNYTPQNTVVKTRDGTINSIRCIIAYIDDPSRGQQENTNVQQHKKIINLFNGDIKDRFESAEDSFITLTGTMFAPFDVFATEIEKAFKNGVIIDKRFRNTYISKDKSTIVIVNDCEDEYGNSAYPECVSSAFLRDKRESLTAYDYACIWRQKPIPPEGLIFAKENLKFYDEITAKDLSKYSVSFIDPTRRSAKDYFSMPICRYNNKSAEYWLTDGIYERKSSLDLTDKVVDKIIENKIVKLVIEENIDGSLGARIKDKLKEKGINWCTIYMRYNTVVKAQRIANMEGVVKGNIRFPDNKVFPQKHAVSRMTHDLMEYTTIGKNLFDDFADSICGLAESFIINENRQNRITSSNKPLL